VDSPPDPPTGRPGGFEFWEIETAKAVVRSHVVAHGRFTDFDEEDLVQECLLHWWQQRDRYEEGRGASRRTFMNRVLTNKLRDIHRLERAEKRSSFRTALSLDATVGSEEAASLGDLLADPDPAAQPYDRAETSERRERILRASRRLTPRQRQLADGLAAGRSISELSREHRVSRDTLYGDRKRIQAIYRAEGLDAYLH
jgi:RNA polymerase sigma factor (sigma-70 family)